MSMVPQIGIDPNRTINGSFGKVFNEGKWMAQYNKMEAKIAIQKSELKLSGSRWVHHKVIGVKGEGSVGGFKINSDFIQKNSGVADDSAIIRRTELLSRLEDPESYGCERIRVLNVMFDEVQLAKWEAGKEVDEELKFTFEGFELLDPIVEG